MLNGLFYVIALVRILQLKNVSSDKNVDDKIENLNKCKSWGFFPKFGIFSNLGISWGFIPRKHQKISNICSTFV